MRFEFSRFLRDVERRVRRIKGLMLAATLLVYMSAAALAANLLLRFVFRGVPTGWGYVATAALLVAVPIAFVAGWSKRPSMSPMLLRLDDALGSDACISSLYEVRTHDTGGVFRDRLEASVAAAASSDWRRGLPVPKRTMGTLSAGILGVVMAAIVPLIPVSQPDVAASGTPQQSETSAAAQSSAFPDATHAADADDRDSSPSAMDPQEEMDISPRAPTEEHLSPTPDEELTLDSVLDDLTSLAEGRIQVDAPPTSEELMELAEAQEEARQALTEMLEELQQQMGGRPRPLTQQESRTMQDLASQTGNPEIEERTDELVDEPDPEQIGEKLQDLLEEMDPDAAPPETSPETDEEEGSGSGPSDTPQSTEISGDEEAGQRFLERTADELQEQADAETEGDGQPQEPSQPRDDSDAQDPQDEEGPDVRIAGEPDDLSQQGGSEGLGGLDEESADGEEVGFVREEAPSTVGEQGEFTDEFVTKGVPVEVGTASDGRATRIVDFEKMASIVRERGVPNEAVESVRKYFELITGAEGGS